MPVQINIFLLLFGGLQGLLLSAFLIRKKAYRTAHLFLILYIFVMLIQITLKVMSKMWLFQHMPYWYFVSYRLPFVYGPLVYLLTLYLLYPNKKFHPKQLLHFLPFLISVYIMFDLAGRNVEVNFFQYLFWSGKWLLFLQLASTFIYHMLAWRMCIASRTNLSWLKQFIIISTIACCLISIAIYYMYVYFPQLNNIRFAFVGLAVLIYWISFAAMNKPDAFSVTYGKGNTKQYTLPLLTVHRKTEKYKHSGLTKENAAILLQQLRKLVITQKPYLDPLLTIDTLAAMVNCSRHDLSQLINHHMGKSFYIYINELRVEEAKVLLLDPANHHKKIASLAYDAGFNSLSVFNEVFKKMTGQTPSQFRKSGNSYNSMHG